jgi:hypothetical protein
MTLPGPTNMDYLPNDAEQTGLIWIVGNVASKSRRDFSGRHVTGRKVSCRDSKHRQVGVGISDRKGSQIGVSGKRQELPQSATLVVRLRNDCCVGIKFDGF